ncbi:uncharacterized protein LOC131693930 [Topomyia yanbarensis]|uniref:uncharacterized protein LOC131693930 n=1 Tax=Topomyia yanbarensis TaxID=2498891 RepID=UPI00273B9E7C|nr:uncharacterized protein LOC131693930 [Topomyia yanbarensis]
MTWERPTTIPYPMVWHEFQGPDLGNTDNLVTYRVQDLTPNRFDDMVQHFLDHYLDEEPECVAKGISGDALAKREIIEYWRWCFGRRLTLVCYKDGSREIVGGNLLNVRTAAREDVRKVESEKLNGIFTSNEYLTDTFDVFGHYGVDKYCTAYGMAVRREYRGMGICREMLLARIPMCKAFGLALTSTNFTSAGAQAAAAKAGFRNDFEISYDDLAKLGYTFPNITSRSTKVMSLIIK